MKRFLLILLVFAVISTGCKSMWKGTVTGAATGLVVGGSAGKLLGNSAVGSLGGAIIGGSIGAVSSSIRKKNMEKEGKVTPVDSTQVSKTVSIPTH